MQLNLTKRSRRLLYLFLSADIAFIIVHLIHVYTPFAESYHYSIEADRGYGELFQYLKEYWIVIILGLLAFKKRSILYLSWSLLFFYVLLDDAIQIHEQLGMRLSDVFAFSPKFNLRAIDFGELLVSATVGLFFLIIISTAYRFGDRISKNSSRTLIVLLLALALFGIIVDMLHQAIAIPALHPLIGLLEDGGEHVIMSIIACFVFLLPDRMNYPASQESEVSKFPSFAGRDF
ncbi:MAG TPA: hypothetical protein DDZ80_13055 [Cyanobacteria bacterium UBA8803]|nr:hypothetical protein [Cyanobacteria bacterium UBA9273]HBL59401.1 hypothetical protein [Cyanobacteria bacterium UBA8803]